MLLEAFPILRSGGLDHAGVEDDIERLIDGRVKAQGAEPKLSSHLVQFRPHRAFACSGL